YAGEVVDDHAVDELRDALASLAVRDEVGLILEGIERVRDRDTQPARAKEGVVVLGVADPDQVREGQRELHGRASHAASLVEVGGKAKVPHRRGAHNVTQSTRSSRAPAVRLHAGDVHAGHSEPWRHNRTRRERPSGGTFSRFRRGAGFAYALGASA